MSNLYRNKRYYFALLLVVLGTLFMSHKKACAQKVTKEYTNKHYTIHDGLAQMQVMSIYKDSKGYLWCNTKSGISRFDGQNFKNFTKGFFGSNGTDILTFGEDSSQNLIIFSSTKLTKIIGDSVQHFDYPANVFNSSSNNKSHLKSICEINVIDPNKRVETAILNYENPDSMFVISVNQDFGHIFYFDEKDENIIWQTNGDSIYIVDFNKHQIVNSFANPEKINSIVYSGGKIFGVSASSALYSFKQNNFELILRTGFNNNYFHVIPTPGNDAFIIKTSTNLYIYKNKLELIKENLTFIRDMVFDDEENLWVATEEGLYNFFQLNFVNYSFGRGNKDWVWSVIEDNDKNMWFASYQNGLWKWDGNKITDYTKKINSEFGDLIKNKPGQPFFRYYMGASKSSSALYFPTECNVLKYNGISFSPVQGLTDAPFQITKTYPDGTLLCGGYAGLYEIKQNGKIRKWERESLKISSVLNVERDKNQNLVAVGKGGVAVIKKDTILNFATRNCLQSYCLTKDHKNNFWIGGIENINLFHDDSIRLVTQKKQEAFYSILFVEPHHLLLGGIKGLYLVNLNDYYKTGNFEMVLFTQNSGFTGIECGQNGFFTDSEGMVWIPTSDLVTRFDPQKLIEKKIDPPKIFIKTEVSSDNISWSNMDLKRTNLLKYISRNIRFRIDAVSFANIGNLRFYYQLKGLQNDWSEAVETNEISFYNLTPGEYQFLVKADSGISNAMSEIIIVDFEIEKPFWMKWWFVVLLVIIFVFTVVLIIQYFRKKEQKKSLIKQRMIHLRSEALSAQLDPHFVMNCLNNISGLVNAGYKKQANDYIVKFSQLLRVILQSVKKDTISLNDELEMIKKYMELEQFRCDNCFDYNIVLPKKYSTENILVPPMILQPLIENSIKHGFNGMKPGSAKIEIKIMILQQTLMISITDNGNGIQKQISSGTGLGTKITRERIQLLQQKNNIQFNIRNLKQGVEVFFEMPLVLKNQRKEPAGKRK